MTFLNAIHASKQVKPGLTQEDAAACKHPNIVWTQGVDGPF